MRDDAALQLESRIGGIVGGRLVGVAVFIPTSRNMGRAHARYRLHRAEDVIQDIAPVAQHVDDDAAAVFLAIVPRRPLAGDGIAFEHPVAELATDGLDVAEKAELA